ncbi:S-layer homology domain-containing protein [Effusibacillus consociatus]|uniref:S-layer homology domain-containing protein n=1 Tax=Effusibacillus consociatus TaxID=1117041 RepID=A0ABV9Q0G4_9BACL
MKKRWIAFLVAGSLSVSLAGAGLATVPRYDEGVIFTDIEGHWAKPAILKLYHAGIVKGVGDGKYAPDQIVTREQILTLIIKSLGTPVEEINRVTFSDVPASRWSHPFVEAAAARSIIEKDSKFEPMRAVTRAEAAVWVSRAVPPMNTGIGGGMKAPFSDIAGLPESVQSAISHVYHLGIMVGDRKQFRPNDTLTRGEAAVLISNLADRIQSSMGGQGMAFKKVDPENASPAVQSWVASKKEIPGPHSISMEGKTYILVSRGQKPNPGYEISISKVVEEPDRIAVTVEVRNPQPGMIYAQVITTPFDLVEIPETNKPIELKNAVN